MPNQDIISLRNRILGIMIQNARKRAHLSRRECAAVLGLSVQRYAMCEESNWNVTLDEDEIDEDAQDAAAEEDVDEIDEDEEVEMAAPSFSLPELELLGRFLSFPLSKFRVNSLNEALKKEAPLPRPELFLAIRHRIIGGRLRQARLEAGRTESDLANLLECELDLVEDYEAGKKNISYAELEIVARAFNLSLGYFTDRNSPIGEWHALQEQAEQFAKLPLEIRDFVVKPINQSYLELAMKLASMPAGALRAIAEGILEITF